MREGKVEIPVDDYLDLLKDKKALEENEVKVCEYTAGTACVRTMIHYCTIDDTVQKIATKCNQHAEKHLETKRELKQTKVAMIQKEALSEIYEEKLKRIPRWVRWLCGAGI